ncbi:PMEI domain-containing protein [Citrus sinensis]|nr:PMEI domain-containing protein [Citrus sinensis]
MVLCNVYALLLNVVKLGLLIEEIVQLKYVYPSLSLNPLIDVNGEHASPLYKLLKLGKWGIFGDDIQWNFAKFLVDKNGEVVDRYYPTTSPLSLERDIKKLLGLS